MVEKSTDKDIASIRKLVKEKKAIIGTKITLKNLKLGKIKKVYFSLNCPEGAIEGIKHYAKLTKAEVVKLKYPNDELGILCKKPFSISVLSIKK